MCCRPRSYFLNGEMIYIKRNTSLFTVVELSRHSECFLATNRLAMFDAMRSTLVACILEHCGSIRSRLIGLNRVTLLSCSR